MKTIRIFISSPGDAGTGRERAREVVESLGHRNARRFHLKPILLEDLPLQPDISFQKGIDLNLPTHGSRLRSPMGAAILKYDGSRYRSGTERELDLMLNDRVQSGGRRPYLIDYTRQDEATFYGGLRGKYTADKEADILKKGRVESFTKGEIYDSETQTNILPRFDRPSTSIIFRERFNAL